MGEARLPVLTFAPIVRILLDYRPALVTRTGVGEYVHRLAEALVRVSAGRDAITLFAASWKDRLQVETIPGTAVADPPGCQRGCCGSLWQRGNWPSLERLAGGPWDIVQSALPTLLPSRTGVRLTTGLRPRLPQPSRADPGGVHRPLCRAGPPRRRRDRPRHRHLALHRRRSRGPARRAPEAGSRSAGPGRPAWPVRMAPPPASLAYLLFVGTLEPRKNVAGLLEAYGRLVARKPAGAAAGAGRAAVPNRPGPGPARAAPVRRPRPAPRLHPRGRSGPPSTPARRR
jgi:hypothetical protein